MDTESLDNLENILNKVLTPLKEHILFLKPAPDQIVNFILSYNA